MNKEETGKQTDKYFDPEEYNTINVGETNEKTVKALGPVEELLDLLRSRMAGEKDTALSVLKKENALQMLMDAVSHSKNSRDKALLVAAFWESGIDLKGNFGFFADLAHDEDLFVSMEAITVLTENLGAMDKKQAGELVKKLEPALKDHFNAPLIEDLIGQLKQL